MIKFYTDANLENELRDYEITTMHNGFTGESHVFQLYLGNTDSTKTYSDIDVSVNINSQFLNRGWGYKVYITDTEPSLEEWSVLSVDTPAELGSIDSNKSYSVYFRITCPAGEESEYYKNIISLSIAAVEGTPP